MNNPNQLPPNHKRILSVTVKTVEEILEEIEVLLNTKPDQRKIRKIILSYNDDDRKIILEKIHEFKTLNYKIFDELQLTRTETYESNILEAKLTYLWTILADSKSKNLNKYGELSDEICKNVDERMDLLVNTLKAIRIK
jgi:uncharacterized protein with ParB-like and HNH nuclease domain